MMELHGERLTVPFSDSTFLATIAESLDHVTKCHRKAGFSAFDFLFALETICLRHLALCVFSPLHGGTYGIRTRDFLRDREARTARLL